MSDKEQTKLEQGVYQLVQIDKAYKRIALIAKYMTDAERESLSDIAEQVFGIGMRFK